MSVTIRSGRVIVHEKHEEVYAQGYRLSKPIRPSEILKKRTDWERTDHGFNSPFPRLSG